MNLLKSWRESFSYFKPSFFKESFGLLKGFLPFFLKYFSWAFVLYVIFGFLIENPAIVMRFVDPNNGFLILQKFLLIGKRICLNIVEFSLIVFIYSKYFNGKDKRRLLEYLLIFIVWVLSVYFIGQGIEYFSRFLYEFIYGPVSMCTDEITKAFWLFGNIHITSFINLFLLFFPVTIFFAFELLRPTGSIKNIFRPFFSYPFFIVFINLTYLIAPALWIKYFIDIIISGLIKWDIITYQLAGIFGFFSLFVTASISIFLHIFWIAVIANVYIKQCKKEEGFLKAGFFRFFGK